jgi:hypothetical protein
VRLWEAARRRAEAMGVRFVGGFEVREVKLAGGGT